MKELNKFRHFLNEGKEETNEGLGDGGIQDKMLNFAMGVFKLPGMNRVLYNMVTDPKARELVKMSDEDIKMIFDEFNIELPKNAFKEGEGLEEDKNDAALDEIINEAKPNLKKALPTIAARNVERNNNINFDIESMMDMVGEAGKGEKSEEAKILFRASNASSDLEQALVDLQIYFEDDLGEGEEEK